MKTTLLHTVIATMALIAPAQAASTDWQELGGGKARVIANKDPLSGKLEGIVEVRLDEGWKTYWRSPGGSGIAPEFDFSRSTDSFVDTVDFPTPEWITLDGASFYGYKGSVAFPFSGIADRAGSDIDLDLLIGVCEEICIPATAQFKLSSDALNRSDPKSGIAITLAKSKLPAAPDDQHRVEKAWVDGKRFHISGGFKSSSLIKAVIAADGMWVSDPKEVSLNEASEFQTSFKIPGSLTSKMSGEVDLLYSLIEHERETGNVLRVVEGKISATKSAD